MTSVAGLVRTVVLALVAPAAAASGTPDGFDEWLETLRSTHQVPAVAVVVVDDAGVVAQGVAGVRILGLRDPVVVDDRFQLASLTKAFATTAVARLVEQGVIDWDTRVIEALPELDGHIHRAHARATLEELLSHRARVPAFVTGEAYARVTSGLDATASPTAQRLAFAREVLRSRPAAPAGGELYSNAGYAVAAAMVERRAGQSWEALMHEQVLAPLGITTAGYGWPAAEQAGPWGHYLTDIGLLPHPPTGPYRFPGGDSALAASSGALHMSLPDAARFALLHLRALRGQPRLLTGDTFQRLHAPPVVGGHYALGWERRGTGRGATSFHDGNTGVNRAWMVVMPQRNVAMVVATTADNPAAVSMGDMLVERLLERYGAD